MAQIIQHEIFDPQGKRICYWSGDPPACVDEGIRGIPGERVFRDMCGLATPDPLPTCTRGEVITLAQKLEFVSRDGASPGFLNILPGGMLVEQVAEAFNRQHLAELGAVRIDFPLIFERTEKDVAELTLHYENQNRMFRLSQADENSRLAYASDPSLFSWLRGRCLADEHLPYTIFTPLPVFRRLQSGEIGGLDKLRQYQVPDLHILCRADDAFESYLKAIRLDADGARFWFREDFAQFADIVEDVYRERPQFGAESARAAGAYTLIRTLAKRTRYYAWRSGIMIHAGFAPIMLYNLQFDDTNAKRFAITLESGQPLIIIHATVAGGWPKLLPLFLGRGLSGQGPKALPIEIAPKQLAILPLTSNHVAAAAELSRELAPVLRVDLRQSVNRPIASQLARLRRNWQPWHVVIGDREAAGEMPKVYPMTGGKPIVLKDFLSCMQDRLDRCRPHFPVTRLNLPFSVHT